MNDSSALAICQPSSAPWPHDEKGAWAVMAQKCQYRRGPLAELLQVSSRTLDRYFKKHLSTTVGTWLRELRLTHAYDQIQAGQSLKEASFATGFKQASHFSRTFKSRFGILPSILRGSPREVLRARLHEATADKPGHSSGADNSIESSEQRLTLGGRLAPVAQAF
jgi:AraC-like DNA-binding protein